MDSIVTFSTRILVAVADLRKRDPILLRLSLAGYPTRTAASGRDAVEALRHGIHAMIMDMDIPGRSCIEVLTWMQRTGRRIPVLLVADNPRLDVLRAASEMGVRACLRTPVDDLELLGRIRAMVSEARETEYCHAFAGHKHPDRPVGDSGAIEVIAQQMSVNVALGLKISKSRRDAGLTQAELARRVAVAPLEMDRVERGESAVSASKLHAIAEALNTPLSYFFE